MPVSQTNSDNQNIKTRNVAPTIIIGLGGTGKEVLLRLRRRFFERYNVFGFPTVSYLWIDTDTRNIDIDDKPLDHIMEQVMFREEEKVDAQIPGETVSGYFRDKRAAPHIFNWLDTSFSAQGGVINGAGQIRPLGRLAFFHHYEEIRGKLDKMAANVVAISAIEEMRDKYEITADPNLLDVIIVFSVAGGTGSGMFLDTAFMCRQALNDSKRQPNITGYVLLPSAFSDGSNKESRKIYANAYAALKELEFYSLRKDKLRQNDGSNVGTIKYDEESAHDFEADWENRETINGLKPAAIQPPPFSTCYLIDNETQNGGKVGPNEKSHLCDMIAENIFLKFSAEFFARLKDSVRSNLEQYLDNPLVYRYDSYGKSGGYTEIFAQRFSSFGFSKLTVPVDRIRRACGYKLSLDLIDSWLKSNELSVVEVTERLKERELAQLKLRREPRADDFMNELSRVGEKNFDIVIAENINKWRTSWREQVKFKSPNLRDTIEKAIRSFDKRNFDKKDARPENWGELVKALEQNHSRFLRLTRGTFNKSRERLDDGTILSQVRAWLAEKNVRLPLAIEYLKSLAVILENHRVYYQQELDRVIARSNAALADAQIKLGIVGEEESGKIVWRKSLAILVDLICDKLIVFFQYKMRRYVLETAINLIETELKPYIGKEEIKKDPNGKEIEVREGLVLDLWNLQKELNSMRRDLQARFASFEKAETHKIFDNLYKEGMFFRYYKIQDGEGQHPVDTKLEELEALLLQYLKCRNPYDIRALIGEHNFEGAINNIDDFCYSQFQQLDVDADAMEIFKEIYTDKTLRSERLTRLVNNASVWMPESNQATTYKQIGSNMGTSALLSYSPNHHDRYKDIYAEIDSLIKAAGYLSPQLASTNRTDTVFLYTECAGIPLAYVHNIERYRADYFRLLSEQKPLHIDVHDEKFTDIFIKTFSESELTLRAKKCLLIGSILKVIKITKSSDGEPTFLFISHLHGIPKPTPLGEEMLAVETLKNNSELLDKIEKEIAARKEQIYEDQENKSRLYALIAYHIQDGNDKGEEKGPFAKYHLKTPQGMIEMYSPEYKVLSEELKNVFNYFSTEGDSLAEHILDQYNGTLNHFSEEIVINNRRWRLFKEGLFN